MRTKHRVLISARDPGAAGSVGPLAEAFRSDGGLDVDIAASGQALRLLRARGKSPIAFTFDDSLDCIQSGEDPSHLLDEAKRLIERARPDAVLVSLSTFGVGLDEALLAVARVPTFAMQDFWGDANLGLGVAAGLYFALDEYAAHLTKDRWDLEALPVGSPKHMSYADLDVVKARAEARRTLGVDLDERIIGYFGQSPAIPGVEAAFRDLVDAVEKLEPRPTVLLREHPKSQDVREQHAALVQECGLTVADVTGSSFAESWLAASDVVTTTLSLCGLDHAYLSAYSPQPIGSVLYLMTNEEIRDYAQQSFGLSHLPTVNQGLGRVATEPARLAEQLELALGSSERRSYFEASKRLGKADPCGTILATVTSALLDERVPPAARSIR